MLQGRALIIYVPKGLSYYNHAVEKIFYQQLSPLGKSEWMIVLNGGKCPIKFIAIK